MTLSKILQTLHEEPLIISPGAHAALVKLLDDHRKMSAVDFAQREGVGSCGQAVEVAQYEVVDGVGVIPIGGPVGTGFGKFEKGQGCVDWNDVADEIDQAEEDPEVKFIMLDVDSPGGMVQGTPEIAERISDAAKRIYTFSAGQICSAAYWPAASTDGIYVTPTANIGSIGVYIPVPDYSEALKQQGISIQLFTSGKFKGMGYPGTSLTKDQQEKLQERVSSIAEMFYAHVRDMRNVPDDAMQGQTFLGKDALNNNLVDSVVRNRAEAVQQMWDDYKAQTLTR